MNLNLERNVQTVKCESKATQWGVLLPLFVHSQILNYAVGGLVAGEDYDGDPTDPIISSSVAGSSQSTENLTGIFTKQRSSHSLHAQFKCMHAFFTCLCLFVPDANKR